MAKQSWRLLAAALALLGFVTMAWAETEVDPGAVSDGLKAIFKYGPGTHDSGSTRISPTSSNGSPTRSSRKARSTR